MKTPNHTRSNVRIKFPDGYLLQGTFGALEKISDVYQFVRENLKHQRKSGFYLYETPPKRELGEKAMAKNLV